MALSSEDSKIYPHTQTYIYVYRYIVILHFYQSKWRSVLEISPVAILSTIQILTGMLLIIAHFDDVRMKTLEKLPNHQSELQPHLKLSRNDSYVT